MTVPSFCGKYSQRWTFVRYTSMLKGMSHVLPPHARQKRIAQAAVVTVVATLTAAEQTGALLLVPLVFVVALGWLLRLPLRPLPVLGCLLLWAWQLATALLSIALGATIVLLPVALLVPALMGIGALPLLWWLAKPRQPVQTALVFLFANTVLTLGFAMTSAGHLLHTAGQDAAPLLRPSWWIAAWQAGTLALLGWRTDRMRALATPLDAEAVSTPLKTEPRANPIIPET
jgi:hypothetical protein